jgi:ABC-type sugar transport system, periplasmic component
MDRTVDRRDFLKMSGGALAGIGALGLAGCGTGNAAAAAAAGGSGTTPLQITYWGSASRAKRTNKAIQLYQQRCPHTEISGQFTDFGSYWPKLATQISGGGAPDLIQMDMRYLDLYVNKGLLLNLSPLIKQSSINLHDFNQQLRKGSEASGTVYGVPWGANFFGLFYDQNLLDKAGVGRPELMQDWTWERFAEYALSISKALGPNVYGSDDQCGVISPLEYFIRQHGKEMYTLDGQRGFDKQDILDWLTYWINMRKTGACIPPSIASDLSSSSAGGQNPITVGIAAITFGTSNTVESYQNSTLHKLGIYTPPLMMGSRDTGNYLKAAMLLSASASTKYPSEVARCINFLFNDTGAIKTLGVERGIPGSARAQAMLTPKLTALQLAELTLVNQVTTTSRPKLVLDPPGAGEVENLWTYVNQGVVFGKLTAKEAAATFVSQTDKILERVGM